MRNEKMKRGFRLHLLALILALALAWYSINPAPHNRSARKPKGDQDDAKKREAEPLPGRQAFSLQLYKLHRQERLTPAPAFDEESDDFDWPEFIDG